MAESKPPAETVQETITKVMLDVLSIGKNETNSHQKFNFRGIDAVRNAVGPALRRHGLTVMPMKTRKVRSTLPLSSGKTANVVDVTVTYYVSNSWGDALTGEIEAEAFDQGDKATAKAMSVADRSFLLSLLCIPTQDPDPDTYSYETLQDSAMSGATPQGLIQLIRAAKTSAEVSELGSRFRSAITPEVTEEANKRKTELEKEGKHS